jgi:hypothetical protein
MENTADSSQAKYECVYFADQNQPTCQEILEKFKNPCKTGTFQAKLYERLVSGSLTPYLYGYKILYQEVLKLNDDIFVACKHRCGEFSISSPSYDIYIYIRKIGTYIDPSLLYYDYNDHKPFSILLGDMFLHEDNKLTTSNTRGLKNISQRTLKSKKNTCVPLKILSTQCPGWKKHVFFAHKNLPAKYPDWKKHIKARKIRIPVVRSPRHLANFAISKYLRKRR